VLSTSVGNLLLNDALPEDLRDYTRVLDKKGIKALFTEIQKRYPERYKEILQEYMKLGADFASTKGISVSLRHALPGPKAKALIAQLKAQNQVDIDDDNIDDDEREKRILARTSQAYKAVEDAAVEDHRDSGSPYYTQLISGGRGNAAQLNQMSGAELLVADHRNKLIPVPLYASYADGVPPAEYWGSVYGTRRGVVSTKFSVASSGFFCLARGTLVRMADWSTKPIEDIQPGEQVLGADVTGTTFPVGVTARFANGKRAVKKFLFRKGRSKETVDITCTAEHKVLATIKCGAGGGAVHTPAVMPIGKRKTGLALVPAGSHSSDRGIFEPFALLIGLLLGDGCLTGGTPTLSTADAGLIGTLRDLYEGYGLVFPPIKGHPHEYLVSKGVMSGKASEVTARLKELGLYGKKAPEKAVPAEVTRWDQESVSWFIAGLLESDGSVTHTNNGVLPVVKFGVTSLALAQGLKELLEVRFGVYSSSISVANNVGKTWDRSGHVMRHNYPCYNICVANRDSLRRLAGACILPGEKGSKLRSALQRAPEPKRDDSYTYALIGAVDAGEVDTFDIEVAHPDHLFVLANGAIVSNSKQISLAAHRQVVNRDKPKEHRLPVGLPTNTSDDNNVGAVLAKDAGPYKAGTVLTPRIMAELRNRDVDDILVHSPLTSLDEDGGVDAWSAGTRDRGDLARVGDNIGVAAAQALTEPITNSMLAEKHKAGGGAVGKKLGGFDLINKLFQGPEFFQEAAPLAPQDGIVSEISEAPQGGKFVHIGEHKLYIPPGHNITIKQGQHIEEGDDLTDGIPHPADLIKYRGVGEARKVFLDLVSKAFQDSGVKAHRRNLEPVVSGLLNHAQVTDPDGAGDHIVDDIVQYNRLAANYVPRDGHEKLAPGKARGQYLEEPALHYSIGTKVTKRVAEDLDKWDIKDVSVHKNPPPFQSHWERLMTVTSRDPDWQTRLGGFYIGKSLMDAVHRGETSDPRGTSYFPAVAQGKDVGKDILQTGKY
jgi:hypothetical protein